MDRSFLSDTKVVEAARDFVCIRIGTYEDKDEANFVKTRLMGGNGDLRNFGFALASPDFETILRRSERGPNFVYKNASDMAGELKRLAADYPVDAEAKKVPSALPQMKSVRLGVNVASCDGLPSLLIVGSDAADLNQMKYSLSKVIWDEDLAGRFICASTKNKENLSMIEGKLQRGFLVVRPDEYGVKGTVIKALPGNLTGDQLKEELLAVSGNYNRISKTHGQHVRTGRRAGISWDAEVAVPDRRRSTRGGGGDQKNRRRSE